MTLWTIAWCLTVHTAALVLRVCNFLPKPKKVLQNNSFFATVYFALLRFSCFVIFWIPFLGGLSLHLNHLIGSDVANYDWQFGTLPFGLFGSNLDTMDLETYPRTYSGQFWHMSLFDDFRAVWVFSKNGCSQKIKVFSMKEWLLRGFVIQFSVQGSLG